jgi:hypothetical protein
MVYPLSKHEELHRLCIVLMRDLQFITSPRLEAKPVGGFDELEMNRIRHEQN